MSNVKIVDFSNLGKWRQEFRKTGKKLVVTNGCFDILHVGHITYLQQARELGDAFLVGVNGDNSVRGLKGNSRPINTEGDRTAMITALASVDFACIFPSVRATEFLMLASPDVYVKGGDYTLETLDKTERSVVEAAGSKIVLIPFCSGYSTTDLIARIVKAYGH